MNNLPTIDTVMKSPTTCNHTWGGTDVNGRSICMKCRERYDPHKIIAEQFKVQPVLPAKRYRVIEHIGTGAFVVIDTWTQNQRGLYTTKAKAQARARTLNSRQS